MPAGTSAVPALSAVCNVKLAAADLLEAAAALLDSAMGAPAGLQPGLERLRRARDEMERT